MSFADKFYIPLSITKYYHYESGNLIEDTRVFGILIFRKNTTLLYRTNSK